MYVIQDKQTGRLVATDSNGHNARVRAVSLDIVAGTEGRYESMSSAEYLTRQTLTGTETTAEFLAKTAEFGL